MRILGIETSCDETSVAIVENGTSVLSNVIATSKKSFEKLAGVIPEEAARRQVECMIPVLEEALRSAKCEVRSIDAIAVTKGPGLLGSLLVGTTTARVLAKVWSKPLIGVHHTLGHLSSTWLETPTSEKQATKLPSYRATKAQFPILTLSASGGHTDLWYRESHTRGRLLGRTRDDAAGEAFDKGASLLGLPYPGGPAISKLAENRNPHAFEFSLPLHDEPTLDFSFSGLKTALKYLLRDVEFESRIAKSDIRVSDIAASFQHAICAHLLDRIEKAVKGHPDIREVHIVGGVSANTYLRQVLRARLPVSMAVRWPAVLEFCTDNAAMIAAAGFFLLEEDYERAALEFETEASLPLSLALR